MFAGFALGLVFLQHIKGRFLGSELGLGRPATGMPYLRSPGPLRKSWARAAIWGLLPDFRRSRSALAASHFLLAT